MFAIGSKTAAFKRPWAPLATIDSAWTHLKSAGSKVRRARGLIATDKRKRGIFFVCRLNNYFAQSLSVFPKKFLKATIAAASFIAQLARVACLYILTKAIFNVVSSDTSRTDKPNKWRHLDRWTSFSLSLKKSASRTQKRKLNCKSVLTFSFQ